MSASDERFFASALMSLKHGESDDLYQAYDVLLALTHGLRDPVLGFHIQGSGAYQAQSDGR